MEIIIPTMVLLGLCVTAALVILWRIGRTRQREEKARRRYDHLCEHSKIHDVAIEDICAEFLDRGSVDRGGNDRTGSGE